MPTKDQVGQGELFKGGGGDIANFKTAVHFSNMKYHGSRAIFGS